MTTPINHDFDNKQEAINWEDHIGLTFKAAEVVCFQIPQVAPHFDFIVECLASKLWELARPQSEGGTYDHAVARFSTYAVTAMVRYTRRYIVPDILGTGESRVKGRGTKIVNMHSTRTRGDRPLAWMIDSNTPCPSESVDTKDESDFALASMSDQSRQAVILTTGRGNTCKHAAGAVGFDRSYVQRRASMGIGDARIMFDEYETGGVAV